MIKLPYVKTYRTLLCWSQLRSQSNGMAESLIRLRLSHAGSFLVLDDCLFLMGGCVFPAATQRKLFGGHVAQVPLSGS